MIRLYQLLLYYITKEKKRKHRSWEKRKKLAHEHPDSYTQDIPRNGRKNLSSLSSLFYLVFLALNVLIIVRSITFFCTNSLCSKKHDQLMYQCIIKCSCCQCRVSISICFTYTSRDSMSRDQYRSTHYAHQATWNVFIRAPWKMMKPPLFPWKRIFLWSFIRDRKFFDKYNERVCLYSSNNGASHLMNYPDSQKSHERGTYSSIKQKRK